MTQPNPYAPPSVDIDASSFKAGDISSDLYRAGDLIVAPVRGARFPDRCVVCNERASKRLKRKLFWHPPGYYALIAVGALIYVIAAAFVRKRAEVEVGLCPRHVARRRNGFLLGWLGTALCFVLLIALGSKSDVFIGLFLLLAMASAIGGAFMAQVVSAKRIDREKAWLKVGKPFLDSFPY